MEPLVSEDKGINLSSPDAPLKLYQKLIDNALLGKDMHVGRFLTDLGDLDSTGAIDQLPVLRDKILEVGQDPLLWLEVYRRTRDGVNAQDQQQIRRGLRLAHLLGMDQHSDDPDRQRVTDQINIWKTVYGEEPRKEEQVKPPKAHFKKSAAGPALSEIDQDALGREYDKLHQRASDFEAKLGSTEEDLAKALLENQQLSAQHGSSFYQGYCCF